MEGTEKQNDSAPDNDTGHLQRHLHQAYSQLEQANTDLVEQVQVLERMTKKEQGDAIRMRNLERENAALRRRLGNLEEANTMTRPGPKLKAFEELTPKDQKRASKDIQAHLIKTSEERNIHPAKLSAFLTYRFSIYFNFFLFLVKF